VSERALLLSRITVKALSRFLGEHGYLAPRLLVTSVTISRNQRCAG
jgi:hypothetical protein